MSMDGSEPKHLRCEHLRNPLGVDTPRPRFSWIAEHPARNQRQRAYQVIISSTPGFARNEVADCWNSGKVESGSSHSIEYDGLPLESDRRYYWRARWWDSGGRPSPFSELAFFETGILNESEWKGLWISKRDCREFRSTGSTLSGRYMGEYVQTHGVYLRKEFQLKEPVRRARVYICGLGLYELRVNGLRVGDRVLDPAQTDYRKIALYSTYDVTGYLSTRNAISVLLGNGRHIQNYGYGPPRLFLQMMLETESGDRRIIASDGSWKAAHGALMENGLYYGEHYDGRLEMPGWDLPHYDDSAWEAAVSVPGTKLASALMEPIRVEHLLLPKSLSKVSAGVFVYDFGQNFTGWARVRVRGPEGTELRLRYAELTREDGSLNVSPNQAAEATDLYVLSGSGEEIYEPRFTYHGFRYVEVTGFPGTPTLEDLQGCFLHTSVEQTGEFTCSDETIKKIHGNVLWGQLSNLMGIPTDCPQRDERYGWLGDAHLAAEESVFNFGLAAFYRKFLRDIRLSQHEEGSLPDFVPPYTGEFYPADPAWASAYLVIAWYYYQHYGDVATIAEHYDAMKKYVDFLGLASEGNIIKTLGKYGDWCPPGSVRPAKTPVELTATWFYYYDILLLAEFAGVLAKKDDAELYRKRADAVKTSFNARFLIGPGYASGDASASQTSNTLPLFLDMVPEEKKAAVLETLIDDISIRHDFHLDTGILGTRFLFDVLTENGRGDLAYRVATQKSYPGWGYMIREGATTLWERWEKMTGEGMNSHNHIMLGSIDAWFYRAVAGITCLSPGWNRIRYRPPLFGDARYASAALMTVRGLVSVSWRRGEGEYDLTVEVPLGAEGEVHVPLIWPGQSVRESTGLLFENGRPAAKPAGIGFRGQESGYLVFTSGSGTYHFRSERPQKQ